ncbi:MULTISPECIES: retropepsin-like aspartic protease family protein [Roseobacteraceae]|uniref:Gag-polyprotein putative aspartyl protease n=1 Tax=Pseudosulfitobacter pseudonitzschiae TaxID=1402135 RepID=A0A221JZG3_9RHOB|nr:MULTISPECIES: TIGR02281 family clan AA aspartic protease [Roseobacteraceae]ASM72146.1 gag-polyprotein putative aspartyl protease [Pseudosulfitobacter pseudonitzschiae]
MDTFDTGRLIYLVLLLLMVVGWAFAARRTSMNKTLQYAAVWGLIILGAVAAVGLWDDISRASMPYRANVVGENTVTVPRSRDGHYYLTLKINDTDVRFVVDTGATDIVLTKADAIRAGINVDALNFLGRANTANGEVATASVRLDRIALGPIEDRNVRAVVTGGEMFRSLLGMGYLQHWGNISIARDTLTLIR